MGYSDQASSELSAALQLAVRPTEPAGYAACKSIGRVPSKDRRPGDLHGNHRLDRPASGVMVLARTSKAAQRLTDQFRQRSPQKNYLALVEGRLQGEGECEDYLVKEKRQVRVVGSDYPKAKRR